MKTYVVFHKECSVCVPPPPRQQGRLSLPRDPLQLHGHRIAGWPRDKHVDRTRPCRCYPRRWWNNSVLLTSPQDTDRFNLSLTKLSTGLPKRHISNER